MISRPVEHRRSVAFLDKGAESWACFLVTRHDGHGPWQGYLAFRPGSGEPTDDEIRTADIFVEEDEAEIFGKVRAMGRPLLQALLDSALHTWRRRRRETVVSHEWFRSVLQENAEEMTSDWSPDPQTQETPGRLESLYASYRLDQVAHLVSLVEPAAFEQAVDRVLAEEPIDFGAMDRVQLAMLVVDRIESLLPLPDFETWALDYGAHPEEYRRYTHALHRGRGTLP